MRHKPSAVVDRAHCCISLPQLEDCQASLQQIVKELDAHPSGTANSAARPAVRGKAAYIRGMSVAMLEGFARLRA